VVRHTKRQLDVEHELPRPRRPATIGLHPDAASASISRRGGWHARTAGGRLLTAAHYGAIKERTVRMYGIAAVIGVACVAGLLIGGRYLGSVVPESVAQLMWFVVVLGGSAFCGYRSPEGAWRWGAIIVAVQPLCLFLLLLAVGESDKPLNSMDGMVAVGIFTALMVFICPIAALASQLGARRKPHQPARQGATP
jgi:hypothetical protein